MATAPTSRKLNLTRDQLAAFLTDQQQIRQFELLFSTVDTLQVIIGTDFEFQADNAAATANEALAQINALAQVVDLNGQAEALSYLAELSKQIQALESAPPFFAPPAVTPASPTTSVQFNNAGAFGASANFLYDTGTNTFTVGPAGATTTIETLAPTGATVAGTLRIRGKDASATNGNGGSVSVFAGNALGTGNGGDLIFASGNSNTAGIAGSIQFTSGTGIVGGGFINFNAGSGVTNGDGGGFSMSAGDADGTGIGGEFQMLAGNNYSASGDGGGFFLQSGYSGSGVGGNFRVGVATGSAGSGTLYFGTDSNSDCFTITEDGSANSQMGFFNVAPVTQPTTAITGATFVVSSGGSIHPTSTFDGYTLAQVVRALRDLGILA